MEILSPALVALWNYLRTGLMKWSIDVFPKMGDITDGSQATQDQTADYTLLALPVNT